MKVKEMSDSRKIWENRRQFSRVSADLAMQYRVIRDDGVSPAWNSTTTKNISAAGLCFESFHPLSLNTMLEINLTVPFYRTPINFRVRVVRAAEIKPGEIYGVAASIVDIMPADRKKLQAQFEQMDISNILQWAVAMGASDVHFSIGHPPLSRRSGALAPMEFSSLTREDIRRMIFSLLNEEQISAFEKDHELTTSVIVMTMEGAYRFRLNVHQQQGIIEATLHYVRSPIPMPEELNLPDAVAAFARDDQGLVIIVGGSGSGISTTCASLIEKINREQAKVILTLQKPIEFMYQPKKSIIKQRQIGTDTHSAAEALEQARFQDVDVIMVNDATLDKATAQKIIENAQAGFLVVMTMTASGIVEALLKIINLFPVEEHYYVRTLLASCLRGLIFQQLMPLKDSAEKQVPATEILVNSPEVAEIIREGLFEKTGPVMRADNEFGMRT